MTTIFKLVRSVTSRLIKQQPVSLKEALGYLILLLLIGAVMGYFISTEVFFTRK